MKTGRSNGTKRGMATAVVAVTLAAIGLAAMPVGIALASTSAASTKARAGITVFDMFDLSPEHFATLMSSSGD